MKTPIGVWRLVRYCSQYDADAPVYPLGEDAVGCLRYTPDGRRRTAVVVRERAGP